MKIETKLPKGGGNSAAFSFAQNFSIIVYAFAQNFN